MLQLRKPRNYRCCWSNNIYLITFHLQLKNVNLYVGIKKNFIVTGCMSPLTTFVQSERRGGIFPVTYKNGYQIHVEKWGMQAYCLMKNVKLYENAETCRTESCFIKLLLVRKAREGICFWWPTLTCTLSFYLCSWLTAEYSAVETLYFVCYPRKLSGCSSRFWLAMSFARFSSTVQEALSYNGNANLSMFQTNYTL